MKLISYLCGEHAKVGVVEDELVVDITEAFPDMLTIIEAGEDALKEIKKIVSSDAERVPLEKDKLLAPIPAVKRNIICVGWNYLKCRSLDLETGCPCFR